MDNPHYSLTWDMYSKNFCSGIVDMQQNGDLVDMTIAADGHLVKVHKMVMCLASPYIKELISTAPCSHPVIFLAKLSYHTLCQLLEYIYTGTAQVPQDELLDVIEAGKVLQIKGLKDMNTTAKEDNGFERVTSVASKTQLDTGTDQLNLKPRSKLNNIQVLPTSQLMVNREETTSTEKTCIDINDGYNMDTSHLEVLEDSENEAENCKETEQKKQHEHVLQYTISNQGKLQVILNRFIYRLIWVYTNPRERGIRRWICVDKDTKNLKCNALVYTKDGIIYKRRGIHNHPFHDTRIMKRIQKGAVYSVLQEAEDVAASTTTNKSNSE